MRIDSELRGPGSSPSRSYFVVSLGKRLYSYSAAIHPGACVQSNFMPGAMDQSRGVEMRLTSFGIHVRLRKIMFPSGAKVTNFITNLLHAVFL